MIYSSASNFSADLEGTPDSRPGTWGDAGYIVKIITFKPPAGRRVRILRVYGDFLIWAPHGIAAGTSAGALFGLSTTGPEGSVWADYAADNCMTYVQVATTGEPARAAYDFDVSAGGLLEPDNQLVVKLAVFLNTTNTAIHMEPSFCMEYTFEDENAAHNKVHSS